MVKRLSGLAGVLKRITYALPKHVLKSMYFAYFHSVLSYLSPIWGSAPNYKLQEIQVIQNRAIKNIYSLPYLTHSVDLYKDNILPIVELINYDMLVSMYKIKNKSTKTNFSFTTNNQHHHHNTRSRLLYRPIFARSKLTQSSIFSRGLNMYNSLPESIKSLDTISKFKKYLGIHLLNIFRS